MEKLPIDPADPGRRAALADLAKLAMASLVAAVLPRVRVAAAEFPRDVSVETWQQWIGAALATIAAGVDRWAEQAQVVGGVVNGSTVFLPPGSLVGPSFEADVDAAMKAAGAPGGISAAVAGVAWEAWNTWASSFHATLVRALPTFAALPAAEAPPTALRPVALRKGSAPGGVGLSVDVLSAALLELLAPDPGDLNARAAIARFAQLYSGAFSSWVRRVVLRNLVGSGFVPSFAPPYVPVGPVVAGDVSATAAIAAPPFGQ